MYALVGYKPPVAMPVSISDRFGALKEQFDLPRAGAFEAAWNQLPPPPAASERLGELDDVRGLVALRDEPGRAWAGYMDHYGATTMWHGEARAMRTRVGRIRGMVGTAAMHVSMGATLLTGSHAAKQFPRQARPFQAASDIELIGAIPKTTSYPSGHTRVAYSAASVLARTDPANAAHYFDMAAQVGIARSYAGAHLPSDVRAGARFGIAMGNRITDAVRAVGLLR